MLNIHLLIFNLLFSSIREHNTDILPLVLITPSMTQIYLTRKFFFTGISELRDIIEKMMDEKNRG